MIPQPGLAVWSWAGIFLLLAVAQVAMAGYEFGVGNQGIQVPFLQRAIHSGMFSKDMMVTTTGESYPTLFFQILATPARWISVERLYFLLHVTTTLAGLVSAAWLARSMFESVAAGIVTVLLLLAGHHQALGGDGLYSTGFTHTFAVFPLAMASLALMYRRRYLLAAGLAGLTFNLHALTSAYVLVFLIAGWIGEYGVRDVRKWWWRAMLPLLLFFATAVPTLATMVSHRQSFDTQWVGLTHIRSADHSFPSSWWQSGSPDVPRFALLAGLFGLSLSFQAPTRQRNQSLAILVAAAAMFLVGYALTEWWPVPVVIRAQLYRCSRLVMVLFFAHIAYAVVRAYAISLQTKKWTDRLEVGSGLLTLAVIAVPAFLPLLPLAFVMACLIALANGRLSVMQAVAAGVTVTICVAAARDVDFRLLGVPKPMSYSLGIAAAVAAGLLALLARLTSRREQWFVVPVSIAVGTVILAFGVRSSDSGWTDVQSWAGEHSPAEALFLTPIQPGGFRLRSSRSVVGEWRDGTQLYFSGAFADQWWQRMKDLQPGLLANATGRSILSAGRPLETLDDESLEKIAEKYGATFLVLPKRQTRRFPVVYENAEYAVYLPKLPEPQVPSEASNKEKWLADERFMRETVLPNIEKHRKGDVRLQLLDKDGRPMSGASVDVRQVRQAFAFSASIPFFSPPPPTSAGGDFRPRPVQQPELDRFREIFNSSMIPFSGKWMYIEPREGERHYDDLDRYVNWCITNQVRMEFHFLSGYSANWVKQKTPEAQGQAFLSHAKSLAERYGEKIESWQVVNETILIQQSPAVFRELRRMLPNAKLGISDCAKFAPETKSLRLFDQQQDLIRGLEEIRWLKQQGIKLDFFGFHGHRPFGLWAEASEMYAALDRFAKEGVRIHVTELSMPQDRPVISTIRSGSYTPEVQAKFYERYYTICYSHPDVDLINLWGIGPNTWQPGSGLLDTQFNPKPAWFALKKLITETWRTNTTLTLGLDGGASFRGFHGDYLATIKLSNGQTAVIEFAIKPGDPSTVVRAQLSSDGKFVPVLAK